MINYFQVLLLNFKLRCCSAARSLIHRADKAGIRAVVAQQFAVAAKVGCVG